MQGIIILWITEVSCAPCWHVLLSHYTAINLHYYANHANFLVVTYIILYILLFRPTLQNFMKLNSLDLHWRFTELSVLCYPCGTLDYVLFLRNVFREIEWSVKIWFDDVSIGLYRIFLAKKIWPISMNVKSMTITLSKVTFSLPHVAA